MRFNIARRRAVVPSVTSFAADVMRSRIKRFSALQMTQARGFKGILGP